MKNPILKFIALASMVLIANISNAQEPPARLLSLINPSQSIGIHIGDVIERKVVIEISSPYQISKNSLPMKGANQNGIELTDVQIKTEKQSQKTIYTIALRYQVFAHSPTPVIMKLPSESFALTGGQQALVVSIPVWRFWFSPLVTANIGTAKESLQPQFKPSMIDLSNHQYRLAGFLGLLIIGLAGLVYINADKRWLPFMNGAFAQAYRGLKRLPKTQGQEKKALLYLHQAFNQVYGANLFMRDITQFLAEHPEFSKIKTDIETFFEKSGQALFAEHRQDSAQFINDLISFSKTLRDCERGVS